MKTLFWVRDYGFLKHVKIRTLDNLFKFPILKRISDIIYSYLFVKLVRF